MHPWYRIHRYGIECFGPIISGMHPQYRVLRNGIDCFGPIISVIYYRSCYLRIHIRPPVLPGIESQSHNFRITICVTPMEMESYVIWAEQKILNSQSPRPGPCRDRPCGLHFRNGLKYPEFPLKAKKKKCLYLLWKACFQYYRYNVAF